ncbi:MAG: DUF2948 family protein [Alphaproteobacteria bacterium]|nr:DUF2948 family protein [Alphaproteobacteria bacterium]
MTEKRLKLKARDAEDIQVISAVLQDSIAPVCDMIYRPEEKNFIMVVHRLRREGDAAQGLERICCAVNIKGVESAQMQNIDLHQQERMLDLLAALPEGQSLQFVFAGGPKIKLQLSDWAMIVEDFGESWPASCNPCHEAESA